MLIQNRTLFHVNFELKFPQEELLDSPKKHNYHTTNQEIYFHYLFVKTIENRSKILL